MYYLSLKTILFDIHKFGDREYIRLGFKKDFPRFGLVDNTSIVLILEKTLSRNLLHKSSMDKAKSNQSVFFSYRKKN